MKGTKWVKIGITLAAAVTLAGEPTLFASAATPAKAATTTKATVKAVNLSGKSYLALRDAQFLMQDKGKVLAYTFSITNNDSKSLDLTDYFFRLKTRSGKIFKATPIDTDAGKDSIAPKSSVNITYYAVVDQSTQLADLQFEIVKWDFSTSNYERRMGLIQYPFGIAASVTPFLDKTMLFGSTKIRSALKQYTISKDDSYAYLTVNMLVQNAGFQSTDLSKLKFQIQNSGSSVFDLTPVGGTQVTLQPSERKIVTLNATIPLAAAAKSLSVVLSRTDDTNKVAIPMGLFSLPPAQNTTATPAGQTKQLYIGGQTVSAAASNVFATSDTDNKTVSLDFNLTNSGSSSFDLPALDFSLKTKDGAIYPLTYTNDEKKMLPKIKKTLTLSGKLPTNIDPNACQLVLRTADTDTSKGYLVGLFQIKTGSQEGTVGSSYTYNDYSVKVNGIQRLAMDDQDLLAAELVITNTTSAYKSIPAFNGYFVVNGVKISAAAQKAGLDDKLSLGPNETYDMVVYSKIPYSSQIQQVGFVLTDPIDDKTSKVVYQFTDNKVSDITPVTKDFVYDITNAGHQANATLTKSGLYESDKDQIFYGEIEYQNKEARAALPVQLGGYLKNKSGDMYALSVSSYKEKIQPNGKVLLSIWAKVPEGYEKDELTMYLGQLIGGTAVPAAGSSGNGSAGADGGNGAAGGDGAASAAAGAQSSGSGSTTASGDSALIKAVAYRLPIADISTTKTDLVKIPYTNYQLSLSNLFLNLSVGGGSQVDGLLFNFNYDLAQTSAIEKTASTHKLILEVVNDDVNKARFSTEFVFDYSPGSDAYKEGTGFSKSLVITDKDVMSKIVTYKNYTVNLYDSIDNNKVLLATKQFTWFMAQ